MKYAYIWVWQKESAKTTTHQRPKKTLHDTVNNSKKIYSKLTMQSIFRKENKKVPPNKRRFSIEIAKLKAYYRNSICDFSTRILNKFKQKLYWWKLILLRMSYHWVHRLRSMPVSALQQRMAVFIRTDGSFSGSAPSREGDQWPPMAMASSLPLIPTKNWRRKTDRYVGEPQNIG